MVISMNLRFIEKMFTYDILYTHNWIYVRKSNLYEVIRPAHVRDE